MPPFLASLGRLSSLRVVFHRGDSAQCTALVKLTSLAASLTSKGGQGACTRARIESEDCCPTVLD